MKTGKRLSIYLPILFALVLIAGIFIGTKLVPVNEPGKKIFSINLGSYNKLNDIVNYISQEYVDSVDDEILNKEAIEAMLENLDPHSQYISADEFHAVNDPLTGNFEGIGIQFRIEKDTIVVIQTIAGGPSEKAGLMPGDRIVNIDDSLFVGKAISNSKAMRKLKGKRGTEVLVSIYRRGVPKLLDFEITRDVIPTYSVDASFMVNDSTGYLKLNKFSATTYEESVEAIKSLKESGMHYLILDLRGNSGGFLNAAIDLSDEFLKDGRLIVYTQGKNRPRKYFYATDKGSFENESLIILIDEGTASASEIVSGAIQDNDRGLIIGRRSFGKGLVQEQMNLPDGSAVRLTVARYYTPTGRSIQKPYNHGVQEYYHEFYERYENGEMLSADSIDFPDSLKYLTPKGKVVYGGGGIMPDIFVPIETNDGRDYLNDLLAKGLIFRFAFEYTDTHRDSLGNYNTPVQYNKQFEISAQLFDQFTDYASENGVLEESKLSEDSKSRIKNLIKAYIARNLYDDQGFYPIYLENDPAFNKALEMISLGEVAA